MKRKRFPKSISTVFTLVLTVAIAAFAASCTTETQAPEQLGVVVTILPQADFVANVGGEKVTVTVMVPPGADPHAYEPTPGQMVKVSRAKIYAKVGSGVEFELSWMDKLLEQNPDLTVIDCSTGITQMGADPHIWTSPLNTKKMVANICRGLVAVDPNNKAYYEQNRDRYLRELDDLDHYIHQRLDRFTNRYFMIYHPSFGYLAAEYNLTQIPVEHEGKEPTPQVIQNCVALAKKYHLSYVFVAPQFATQQAETIARAIGGQTVLVDPLPRFYIASMRSVADALAAEME